MARLAPAGHVVLTDLAAEMLGIAARRAGALGITNFQATVCSADDLPFGDAAFDSILGTVRVHVLSRRRQGDRRVRARAQAGRACVLVGLGRARENSWTTIAMQAIAAEAVLAPSDPDGPGMFRCAAPGYVSALYQAAGLVEVAEWDVGVGLGDGLARAVLGDDPRARLAGSCGACAGRRAGWERIAKAVIARASALTNKMARSGFRAWPAASPARSRHARTGAPAHSCRAAELIVAAGDHRRPAYVAQPRLPYAV